MNKLVNIGVVLMHVLADVSQVSEEGSDCVFVFTNIFMSLMHAPNMRFLYF